MALQVNIELDNGIVVSEGYLHVRMTNINWDANEARVDCALWLNKKQYDLGGKVLETYPYHFDISNFPFTKGCDVFAVSYDAIKTLRGEDIPVRDEKGRVVTDEEGIAEMTPGALAWKDAIDV